MKKLALLLALLLSGAAQAQTNFTMPPPAGVMVGGFQVVSSCGVGSLATTQAYGTMDTTGKFCVAATVSASVTGFAPGGAFATLTATGSSASVALPTGAVVLFQNVGTTAVSCTLGIGSATAVASETIVQPASTVALTVGSNTFGACIDQTGSASNLIVLSGGAGIATGWGGGSGGGSSSITTWAGGTLGAMANYGTSPGAVLVPGMNAFITNTPAVTLASTTITGTVAVTESGTWTVQPGNTPNTTPWLFSPSTGGNTAAVKAASTAPVATDPALVVSISPNSVNANGQATAANSAPVVSPILTNAGAAVVKGGTAVVNGGSTYQAVAASQTATVLQTSTGAIGDYLSHCDIYPTSTSPGVVTVFDNTNAAAGSVILFPGGATSLSNLAPISVPVGAVSTAGAWKVTTGASVSVVCYGKFS